MQNRHSRFLLLVTIAALLLGISVGFVRSAQAQSGSELLQNPGFDGTYQPVNGDQSKLVAPSWLNWAVQPKTTDPSYILVPQFRAAQQTARAHSNGTAQEIFEVFAIYTGGVYQQVTVTKGAHLRFSAFINVWSSSGDDTNTSFQPSPVRMRVGIDPKGGTDGTSANIVWSGGDDFTSDPGLYDTSNEFVVETTATTTTVTVFIEGALKTPIAHGSFFFDDASLTASSGTPGATATETGETVGASDTPTSTVTDTPTGSVTSSATPTATDTLGFIPPTREGTVLPGTSTGGGFVTVTPFGPTPTQSGSTPNLPGQVIHVVVAGDTVLGLAIQYGSDVDAIIAANGLDSSGLIFVGQQLVIPVAFTPTPSAQPPTSTANPAFSPTAPVDVLPLTGPTVNGIGTYIVQPGDTFAAIARRYNVSVQTLAALNGIVNTNIPIGTVLVVPGPGNNYPGGTIAPTVLPTVTGSPKPQTYVVQPGDDLYRISIRFNVTIDALMRANNISNPNLIYVGQTLVIP